MKRTLALLLACLMLLTMVPGSLAEALYDAGEAPEVTVTADEDVSEAEPFLLANENADIDDVDEGVYPPR